MPPERTNLILGLVLITLAALFALETGGCAVVACVLLLPVWAFGVVRIVRLRPSWKEGLASFGSSIPFAVLALWIAHLLFKVVISGDSAALKVLPTVTAALVASTYWMVWRIAGSRRLESRLFAHAGQIAWTAVVVWVCFVIAVPAYQDYTVASNGVRACTEYRLRATFNSTVDAFDVDEDAQVLLALPASEAAKPVPGLPRVLSGWSFVSRAAAGPLDQLYLIHRHSRSTATTGLGLTQVHRMGYGDLIGMCRVRALRLVAPEHVMLRENLIEPKSADVLVEGEDAIAITSTDVVDPPVEVRVARKGFRHPILVSLTGVSVSSSITAVLSGIGTLLLFLGEWLRDFLMKKLVEPLLKKVPFLKRLLGRGKGSHPHRK